MILNYVYKLIYHPDFGGYTAEATACGYFEAAVVSQLLSCDDYFFSLSKSHLCESALS